MRMVKLSLLSKTRTVLSKHRAEVRKTEEKLGLQEDDPKAVALRERRQEVDAILCALDILISPTPPTPHYRPRSRCKAGFSRVSGRLLRASRRIKNNPLSLLTEEQYVTICNVSCKALSEMLEGFDSRSFRAASGVIAEG